MTSKIQTSQEPRMYARIESVVEVRVRLVTDEQAEGMKISFAASPSVWKLTDESTIRSLAGQSGGDRSAVLAQAVLELATLVARLQARLQDTGEPMHPATIVQLSGGGGQISTPMPIKLGDKLEVHFRDDDRTPPIHALVEILHAHGHSGGFGFRFEAIHPHDHDRLIRLIYQIQREALREDRT